VTRIVARICRIVYSNPGVRCLTVEEINQAGLCVIGLVQQAAFKPEFQALSHGLEVSTRSKLYNFGPQTVDGVIRVGGRLGNSSLSLNEMHPILLPKNRHITKLIISHRHQQTFNQRRGQTLNQIRSQGFWILSASKAVIF